MTGGKSRHARASATETWIEAGFAELARSGVEGVRVEVLAKNLGVTKGGFYRRFRDRAALLEAMLQNWREGRIAAIEKQTSLDGARRARTAEGADRALFGAHEHRRHGDRTGDPAMGARPTSWPPARSPASMPRA